MALLDRSRGPKTHYRITRHYRRVRTVLQFRAITAGVKEMIVLEWNTLCYTGTKAFYFNHPELES